MKTKFIFTLLASSGLLFTGAIATASTPNIANLSQSIARSLGLDPSAHSVVGTAIDRALVAKKVNANKTKNSTQPEPKLLGDIAAPIQNPKPKPSPTNKPSKK